MRIIIVPLVWLVVAALVVTACRMASRGDVAAHPEHADMGSSR
jgi:hypothetical protein